MGAARSGMGCTGHGGLSAALAASALLFTASTCLGQADGGGSAEAAKPLRLTIANMNAAGKQIAPAKPEAPAPVWRHTFGAERRAETVRQPVRFSADIVVLQGVTTLAPVRQMFPARNYHLVTSRQLLQQADPNQARQAPVGTTALAIRRDTGLRVIAQDHLLEIAEPPPGAKVALAAATAVRLLSPGRALWVVSFDLAQGCPAQDEAAQSDDRCLAVKKQLDTLDNWLSQHMAAGDAVVLAGRLHRQLDPSALPGNLGRLSAFSFNGERPQTCTDSGTENTYILATPGPHAGAKVTFEGRLEPVDEAATDNGCFLLVDATL